MAHDPTIAASRRPVERSAARSRSGIGLRVDELERVVRVEAAGDLGEGALVGELHDPLPRRHREVVPAVRADPQVRDHLVLAVVRVAVGAGVARARRGLGRPGPVRPADIDADVLGHQSESWSQRPSTSTALWPPNPNEFEIATRTSASRPVFGNVVEVALGVGVGQVDRRRQEPVAHRKDGHRGLDRARRAEQVARLALRRRDRDGARALLAERDLERARLGRVAGGRRGAVRVHVADIVRASRPASSIAIVIARAGFVPTGSGSVTWWESDDMP